MHTIISAHAIRQSGPPGGRPMLFSHGFGTDQRSWQHVAPHFADRHRVVTFDLAGCGQATRYFNPKRYATLEGYARDLVDILDRLDLHDVVYIGHSVSCMIGILAAARRGERFGKMVLLGPSPHYLNDGAYAGGFSREDIDGMLDTLEGNQLGWSSDPEDPAGERNDFCRMPPDVAAAFARTAFLSDHRLRLPEHRLPTLILQASDDNVAGTAIGRFVSEQITGSKIIYLTARGHSPHLTEPAEVIAAIDSFL